MWQSLISHKSGWSFALSQIPRGSGSTTVLNTQVDKRSLMEILKEMDVEGNLKRRITEIYSETGNMVKIEEERPEEFWTARGVRQRYPLSPTIHFCGLRRRYK